MTDAAAPDDLKAIAEAKKLEAEAELARKEIELRDAEIRKMLAEAATAEHDAAIREIRRREAERAERLVVIQDHYKYHHYFSGSVNKQNVESCLNTMAAWHRDSPEHREWTITINSPGGSVIDGMHLFDEICAYRAKGHHVTMIVRGYSASMAGILLQAADVRRMGPESYLMIHEVASYAQGKIGELKDEIKFLDTISDRVVNIFVKRSQEAAKRNPEVKGITKSQFIKHWTRQDWWLSSDDAFRYGFVDEIG